MGTLAVGGVTGWVDMSQELLGLCVIWLHAVLASLRLSALALPPTSAPVGCWVGVTARTFQELKAHDGEVRGLDSRSQASPTCRENLGMSSPSLSYSFPTEE